MWGLRDSRCSLRCTAGVAALSGAHATIRSGPCPTACLVPSSLLPKLLALTATCTCPRRGCRTVPAPRQLTGCTAYRNSWLKN
eukprot:6466955-Amphidinium_carterae.2